MGILMGRAWNRDHLEIIRIQSRNVGKITDDPVVLAAHFNRSVLREAYATARFSSKRRLGRLGVTGESVPENGFVHTECASAFSAFYRGDNNARGRGNEQPGKLDLTRPVL